MLRLRSGCLRLRPVRPRNPCAGDDPCERRGRKAPGAEAGALEARQLPPGEPPREAESEDAPPQSLKPSPLKRKAAGISLLGSPPPVLIEVALRALFSSRAMG